MTSIPENNSSQVGPVSREDQTETSNLAANIRPRHIDRNCCTFDGKLNVMKNTIADGVVSNLRWLNRVRH